MSYSRQICVLSGHPRNQVSASALKCEGGGAGGGAGGAGEVPLRTNGSLFSLIGYDDAQSYCTCILLGPGLRGIREGRKPGHWQGEGVRSRESRPSTGPRARRPGSWSQLCL